MEIDYKYQVIDNFLSNDAFYELQQKTIYNTRFPWFYNEGISGPVDSPILWDFQFTHLFYSDISGQSPELKNLTALIEKINPSRVYRIKANLNPITDVTRQSGWHTDFGDELVCTTAVFYLNKNNGCTVFKNNERVESVPNRLLMFDSRLEHAGTSCTDSNFRSVINLNYSA
jgi:hypothetical protein